MTLTDPLRRPAFSRMELLLSIVLGILMLGLGSAALFRAQSYSRRVYCTNNLGKLGQATLAFQDMKGFLPPSRIMQGHATWAVLIAPLLAEKEANALRSWDLNLSYYAQPQEVRQTQVIGFYCPARRGPQLSVNGDTPANQPAGENTPGALGDYAACAGDGSPHHPWDGPDANGAFVEASVALGPDQRLQSWRGRTSMRLMQVDKEFVIHVDNSDKPAPALQDLKRGTSSTILLGEKHVPWNGFGQVAQGDGSLYNGDFPGSFSRVGGVGFGLAESGNAPYRPIFGGAHSGVCLFLMADDSVRPLAASISPEILGRLTVRESPE
jgi:hypothetical protein